MLTRKSSELSEDFFLLTFGESCFYALKNQSGDSLLLFDCGTSAHVANLASRLEGLKIGSDTSLVVVLLSVSAERIGGLALLQSMFKNTSVLATEHTATILQEPKALEELQKRDRELSQLFPDVTVPNLAEINPVAISKTVDPKQEIQFDERYSFRLVPDYAASPTAAALINSDNILVASESFPLYHPTHVSIPRLRKELYHDRSLLRDGHTKLDLSLLCLPYQGALSGELIARYLESLHTNERDLEHEVAVASESGVDKSEILETVLEQFRQNHIRDPLYRNALESSLHEGVSGLVAEK